MIPPELTPVLPADTAEAWLILASLVPRGAALYGGTGLAAHLQHRVSRDLDFFLAEPADLEVLAADLDRHRPFAIETLSADTLNGLFGRTKVQFLYAANQRVLAAPAHVGGLPVASMPDLLATKLKVLRDRPELRDYFDLMCIEQQTQYDILDGLGFYVARYGGMAERTLPELARALGYFDDVVDDPGLETGRDVIVDYWRRRQPQIVASLGRR